MRIAFMGTPQSAVPCLDALVEAGHQLSVVVTQPDKIGGRRSHELLVPPVKARALELGAPVLQPERARNPEFIEQLRAFGVEAIAVVAYGQILPDSILQMAPRGCVNLHYSLLPRWRGAAPVQYAIWNGDAKTGVTTQWMASKLDAGDIIEQHEVAILDSETSGELLKRLTTVGARVLVSTFALLEAGTASRTPQDEGQATFCPQISREMALLDFSMSARKMADTVRAMNPWPGAWLQFGGDTLKLWRAQTVEASGAAGTILSLEKEGPVVAATGGALQLLEVQSAGKARTKGADWARGARLKAGDFLL